MNIRKIKLALSVGLLNQESGDLLQGVRELLGSFKEDLGHFLGLVLEKDSRLNNSHLFQQYALQYEHAVLQVDVVSNPFTKTQMVQNFRIQPAMHQLAA